MKKVKDVFIQIIPFITFVILNVIYFSLFESWIINYFDCGDFTFGINYKIADFVGLLFITIIYIVLVLILNKKIKLKKYKYITVILNIIICIPWLIYLFAGIK